ncbi:MAG: hypothetical protein ACXACI_04985 [Candidatus Hodarchaeales archaeon]
MAHKLEFCEQSIAKTEQDFSMVTLSPEGRQQITQAAWLYQKYLPLSEMAIKGFLAFAMRDFQMQMQFDLKDFFSLPRAKQATYSEMIGKLFYERVSKVLVKPEQKNILKQAVHEAVEFGKSLS